jgi:hypothetical protein
MTARICRHGKDSGTRITIKRLEEDTKKSRNPPGTETKKTNEKAGRGPAGLAVGDTRPTLWRGI